MDFAVSAACEISQASEPNVKPRWKRCYCERDFSRISDRLRGKERRRATPRVVELIERPILYRMAPTTSRTDERMPSWLNVNERKTSENVRHQAILWLMFKEVASTLSKIFLHREIALFALYKASSCRAWALVNRRHGDQKIVQKSPMILTTFHVVIHTCLANWDGSRVWTQGFVGHALLFRMA